MSIIYAVEATDNEKGLLIDAFGTYANRELEEFIVKVQKAQAE